MHVIVVGAGIIGVCTAYFLRRSGMEVTVLERQAGVARETSFANAGVMAPSYVGPWAQPGMPGKVANYLFKAEAPVVFRPSTDPALWGWIRRWLAECDPARFARNKARMQRLAFYSQSQLHALRKLHEIDYEQATGYLQLFRSPEEVERSEATRAMLRDLGVAHRLVTADEARAIETTLHPVTALAGALHLPDDETGNCAFFAHQLKGIAERDGVNFRFGISAEGFDLAQGRIERLRTSQGELRADAYVVAGGVDSLALLRPLGIRLPLLPVKGYSATVSITALDQAPMTSVMDETYKVAITRMGNRLRIAGTAEVGTTGMKLRDGALRTLLKVASDWFPAAAVYRRAQFWVGARPMLPDGPPVLGPSPIANLYLNTGHGSTGWVMACGSGKVVADVIAGQSAEIDLDGLTIDRYDRRRAA
ncbi:MAG: D-amino acid dehydrogenase [Burkholderiaceae bacterium]|jgi:D-amino-acid dehydrogenase|nr:D-amino acid dehydrogenase [Burkholderiaceae bacterium]